MTVGLQNLSNQNFYNVRTVVPPLHEQEAICAFVERATASVTGSEKTVRQEIRLLLEFRTRLISDVVTGRLDVREAAARLPTELPDAAEDSVADQDERDDDFEGDDGDGTDYHAVDD